jgi:hypothetical protein
VARTIALIILAIAAVAPLAQAAPHPWLPTLLTSAVLAATALWILLKNPPADFSASQ